MSVSFWQQPPGTAPVYECEVAVIGGGICGAYTAYRLAEAGKKVALLEMRFPAAGATGRNAGMSLMGAADNYATGIDRYGRERARALWLLTLENQRKTRAFVEQFNVPHTPCGSLILAIDDEESRLLAQAYELMQEDKIPADFSPSDPLERGFGAAIIQSNDFGLNPVALVQALLQNAPGERVKLFAPAEVFAIHENGSGVTVEARTITVRCEQVALCTNAYSLMVSPYFRDKIRPVRAQMFLTEPVGHRFLNRLAYANYGYEYFRQLEDGSFLLGGGRSRHRDLEVGYDEAATAWLQTTVEEFFQKYFPDIAKETQIVRRWGGTMAFTPDGLPIVGSLPEAPGSFPPIETPFVPAEPFGKVTFPTNAPGSQIYFAVGFNGHGLGWGMVSADQMLDRLLGKKAAQGFFAVERLATA